MSRARPTFSVSFSDKDDRDKVKELFEQIKDSYYSDLSRSAALEKIFTSKLMEPMNTVTRIQHDDDDNNICTYGFLQRIIDRKTGELLYHCLRTQRPDAKGKPILLSDGRDIPSIRKICEACHMGGILHQQKTIGKDAIKAITRFGDSDISIKMCSCIHPENDMVFFSLGGTGSFPCKKTDTRVSIDKICEYTDCPYLHTETVTVKIKDTPAYQEMQKQLTEKGGDN